MYAPGQNSWINYMHSLHPLSRPSIISNRMKFNDDNVCVGWKGEIIHSLNKRYETVAVEIEKRDNERIKEEEATGMIKQGGDDDDDNNNKKMSCRSNILLLGDHTADIRMSVGMKDIKTQLSVGFLNDKIEERRSLYASIYDVVIEGDGTFEFIVHIVNIIHNKDMHMYNEIKRALEEHLTVPKLNHLPALSPSPTSP